MKDKTLLPRPLQEDIALHLEVLFSYCEGFIAMRSFSEGQGKGMHNMWMEVGPSMATGGLHFANWCADNQVACYVLPGTVHERRQAKAEDIKHMQTVLVDLDEGDTEAKLQHLTHYLGLPTLVVNSGGMTTQGHCKLHAYWKLNESYGSSDLMTIAKVRELMAIKVGGDNHFKSLHQPIRLVGSVYCKGETPKLVTIKAYQLLEYNLLDLVEAVETMPPFLREVRSTYNGYTEESVSQEHFADFNVPSKPTIHELLLKKVQAGNVDGISRYGALSSVMGYWIRRIHEGTCNFDHGWQEIQEYNLARVNPPWDIERLQQETARLWKKHVQENGEPIISKDKQGAVPQLVLTEWSAARYHGPAPEQEFLVAGVFPLGVVSILAAMGDTGKGMLTLQLALEVATNHPPISYDYNRCPYAFGRPITSYGTAVIFTAEDDVTEIHRRLERLDPGGKRFTDPHKLLIIPLPNAGGPFSVITTGREGPTISTRFKEIEAQLLTLTNLKLIVFDPLASFVHGDVNSDPAIGSFVTGVLASLATRTGATVIVTHHMRKPSGGKTITSAEHARDAIRGTSALVDGVRAAYALWPVAEEEQRNLFRVLHQPFIRNALFQGAVVKANGAADRTIRTYLRNGAGLLEDITETLKGKQASSAELKEMLVPLIAKAALSGHPFTHTGGTGIYKQRHRLEPCFHHFSRHKLEQLIQELLNERPARIVKGMASGSKEDKWLDIPTGPFATGQGEFISGAEGIL